ncbi:hypothetical protein DPMN_058285 [Dreissena polymorpha]|uniref:Uncharacterized protein n=1 Tax=Dreissena polymorpha TaxID=45954 RepID=A0A9D4C1V2_DREPO|nr:hypothetical protein DPMN_058285 [Dreissena polymorpha]
MDGLWIVIVSSTDKDTQVRVTSRVNWSINQSLVFAVKVQENRCFTWRMRVNHPGKAPTLLLAMCITSFITMA